MALTGKARKGAFREEDGMPGRLLAWYDAHHRDLPWRVPPSALGRGVRPDPYHVWLSEIMLQQTTVEAVKPYFREFLEKWPEVTDLAAAEPDDVMKAWAGLGYYSRARNLKKCADLVASLPGSRFPDDEDGLRGLPGIGAYTAAAIAAIAFGRSRPPWSTAMSSASCRGCSRSARRCRIPRRKYARCWKSWSPTNGRATSRRR